MIIEDRDYEKLSRTAHEWRDKAEGPVTAIEERTALQAWLAEDIRHEEAFDRAETLWAAYDHLRSEDIDADLMPPSETAKPKSQFWGLARVAAIAALILAPLLLFLQPPLVRTIFATNHAVVTYETGVAETKVISLPDGTAVTLGALSRIETTFSSAERTVVLVDGSGLFEVAPEADRPFQVRLAQATATALGTVFEARASGGVDRVAVAEGLVGVSIPYQFFGLTLPFGPSVTLSDAQEVAATEQSLREVRAASLEDIGAWRHGRLVYDAARLSELVSDANRYSERKISLTDDATHYGKETITASFDSTRIEQMLNLLSRSFPVEVDASASGDVLIRPKR